VYGGLILLAGLVIYIWSTSTAGMEYQTKEFGCTIQMIRTILFATFVSAAATVDITSEKAVTDALQKMVTNLIKYYVPGKTASTGTILQNPSKGPEGFQWYEGGIMWGAMMEYIKTTGDATYSTTIVNALTEASYGKVSNFLGNSPKFAETVDGKWNDDILWYALPVATGGEVFGVDKEMPGGVTYHNLADTTFQQVWAQWSADKCGGGLYWSRNREDQDKKGYKSVITHAQQIMLGARLSILTGDKAYLEKGKTMYDWLKTTGLVMPNYQVQDGLNEDQACTINDQQLSYKAGFLIGALGWMYKATGDVFYNDEANKMTTAALTTFTTNNIINDACELKPEGCDQNTVSPKGTMVRGLGYAVEFTNDPTVREQLKTVLGASVQAMLKTCNENFECGDSWLAGNQQTTSVHFQINSVELMTSYLKTFKGSVSTTLDAPTDKPKTGSAASLKASLALLSLFSLL
jgi:mannan endo-1,6-alpha-mannosidase